MRRKKKIQKYEWNDEMMTLAAIASLTGIDRSVLYARLRKGWTIEEAVCTPVAVLEPRTITDDDGQELSVSEYAEKHGIPYWKAYRLAKKTEYENEH